MVMMAPLLLALSCLQEPKLQEKLLSDDVESVRRMIEARPELIKAVVANGRQALSWAGSKEMIEFLLSKGADPNARDSEGWTALYYRTQLSSTSKDLVQALLSRGADPNAGRGGKTALVRMALAYRGEETALLLLEHDSRLEEPADLPNLLHQAASQGSTRIVKMLLELRVKVDVPAHHGSTALHLARMGGHEAAARLLIDAGANVHLQSQSLPPFIGGYNRSFNGRQTPLLLASRCGLTGTARLLLEKGAAPDVRDQFGSTPLHHAARLGNVDLARLLLEYKADVNAALPPAPNILGDLDSLQPVSSPLHLAAEGGSRTLVELLLKEKADLHVRDGQGRTALHRLLDPSDHTPHLAMLVVVHNGEKSSYAADTLMRGDRIEVLKALIQAGADVNAKDKQGVTPLKLATAAKNFKAAEILRQQGAKD